MCQKEALVHQYADRLSLALRTLSQGLRALESADDALDVGVRASRSHLEAIYASCRLRQGRTADAIDWATRAESDAEAAGDKPALARAYDLLFGVYLTIGRTPPKPYGSLALELLEELDNVHLQAQILNQLGYSEIVQGHGAAASEYFERARAAFQRAGDSTSAAMVAYNVGDVLARQGRLDDAEAVLSAALPVFRASSMGEWTESTRRELGRLAVRRGELATGLAMLEQARAALDGLGLALEVAETDVALVEARIAEGDWLTALEDADRARARAVSLDLDSAVRLLDKWRGVALRELGRLDEARAALDLALAACAEEGEIDAGGILVELADVARRQGDPAADDFARRGEESLVRLGVVGRG
jgi:tetratricopeptide (TPR) repeat protein